jgi:hypothetical protein
MSFVIALLVIPGWCSPELILLSAGPCSTISHKGQAKITPGRDDTRAIFNDVTSRRSFLSRIKGVFAAGDDNCHLRRQINEIFVIIRQRTRCVLLDDRYRAFFNDKNHFSTGFQPRICVAVGERRDFNRSVDFRDYSRFVPALFRAFQTRQLINRLFSRLFAVCSRSLAAKNLFATRFRTRWLIIGCERRGFDRDRVPGSFRVPVER